MRFLALFLCLTIGLNGVAQAQALPVAQAFSSVIPRLFGKAVEKNAISRGFAANDPRYLATNHEIANVATGLALAGAPALLAGVGYTNWLGLAVMAGAAGFEWYLGNRAVDATVTTDQNPIVTTRPVIETASVAPPPDQYQVAVPAGSAGSRVEVVYGDYDTRTYVCGASVCQDTHYKYWNDPAGTPMAQFIEMQNWLIGPDKSGGKYAALNSFRPYYTFPDGHKYITGRDLWTIRAEALGEGPQLEHAFSGDTPEDVVLQHLIADLPHSLSGAWHIVNWTQTSPTSREKHSVMTSPRGFTNPVVHIYPTTVINGQDWAPYYPHGTIFAKASIDYVLDTVVPGFGFVPVPKKFEQYYYVLPNPKFLGTVTTEFSEVVRTVSNSEITMNADVDLIVELFNKIWASANPSESIIPHEALNPVTKGQVLEVLAANPQLYPKVGDLLAQARLPNTSYIPVGDVMPNGQAVPNDSPYSGSQTTTYQDPANPPTVITCGLPGTPACAIEWGNFNPDDPDSSQTEQDLTNAIKNGVFSDWFSNVFTTSPGECPKPSFDLFGASIVLESHCSIFETLRPLASSLMAVVWPVVALFIVLSA